MVVIGAMSPAEASIRAQCAQVGTDVQTCNDKVAAQTMKNGVICDGDIVLDASGQRCIPAAVAAAAAAQKAAAFGTALNPAPASESSGPSALVVFGLMGLAGLVAWGIYREYFS